MKKLNRVNNTGYILGISRGHNAGVCLLKDGEVVFSVEEERLSRAKYDGSPLAGMVKVLDYTDKIDYMFVSHTTTLGAAGDLCIEYMSDDIYSGMARKLGLIDFHIPTPEEPLSPQVIDLASQHHKVHAACAFYRSGFDEAVAVVVDGAGSAANVRCSLPFQPDESIVAWEVESIIGVKYPAEFKTYYKHFGTREPMPHQIEYQCPSDSISEDGKHIAVLSPNAGIVKAYEAATIYNGFQAIEAGKTMGLFPYGKPNDNIPSIFSTDTTIPTVNRNLIIPTYPNAAYVNYPAYSELAFTPGEHEKYPDLQNRKDLSYAIQTETQEQVLNLIKSAVEFSGQKNVVLSGGYGLNCVANYHYLDKLSEEGINLYVEPCSNDGGTAIGAALWGYYEMSRSEEKHNPEIYLGPKYDYTQQYIETLAEKYDCTTSDATHDDIVELITSKNIVSLFQGRSENGPRALGNRSLMYDPTDPDGKDFVNSVKHREYFRPFAGSILEEDVHEWFDLRGMESSPTMMYAVNCQPGIEEKIPAIIHIDGTCRIQTVNRDQNPHYYDIIKAFKEKTGCPIIFNTSFNLGGEPLVETLEDALKTVSNSDVEYLYLPEFGKLIFKGNWTPV